MIVKIEIDCETIQELIMHLADMMTKCAGEAERLELDPARSDFGPGSEEHLGDNNCYGTREVTLNWIEE